MVYRVAACLLSVGRFVVGVNCRQRFGRCGDALRPVGLAQPFTIGVNITESETPNTIDVEYFLNGTSFEKITGFAINPASPLNIFLGGSAGIVVYDWYEYAAPINWGD